MSSPGVTWNRRAAAEGWPPRQGRPLRSPCGDV